MKSQPRRSSRQRVSRYVNIDGYNVLKLNDYTLTDGESSVFRHEAKGQQLACSTTETGRSAFAVFLAEYASTRLNDDDTNGGNCASDGAANKQGTFVM